MPSRAWRHAVLSTVVLTALGAAPALADSAAQTPSQGVASARSATPATRHTATRPTATQRTATGDRGERVLPGAMRGRAAVKKLGKRLEGVAARNDLSAPALKQLLTEDHTAWLSGEGRLFYQEDAPEEATSGEAGLTALASLAPAYPTSMTFALHSNPGAARTIFLDFDGATVQNTGWNTGSDVNIADGSHIGWDSDGAPNTFNSSEHGWIQEVWRQVAESYAPFDVDVTTKDPGAAGWIRSSSSDTRYGSHVLITSSKAAKSQGCGGCLGLAWVGTFDLVDPGGYYQPAWVFADDPEFAPMIVAQAASHETGHTLGLSHDGLGTNSYYAGTSAWGPIMGFARTRAVSQFSMGEYAGANQSEDDFAVMQENGLPLRSDDHGGTTGTANQLGAFTSYAASGIIGTRTDQDVFAVSLPCTTNLAVQATGIGAQTALDLSLTVLDATGHSVASSPISSYSGWPPVSNGMNASVTVPAAAGTYFLRVDGVGNGLAAAGGWSDYGSLGQFRLTATGCPSAPTPTVTKTVTRPGAPVIRTASAGRRGGKVTAIARWAAPTRTGGAAITRYRVRALRLNNRNRVVRTFGSAYLSPATRTLTMRLPRARYVISVMAWNRVGSSAWSRSSRIVRAR